MSEKETPFCFLPVIRLVDSLVTQTRNPGNSAGERFSLEKSFVFLTGSSKNTGHRTGAVIQTRCFLYSARRAAAYAPLFFVGT